MPFCFFALLIARGRHNGKVKEDIHSAPAHAVVEQESKQKHSGAQFYETSE
jgi:hypothetical protein